MQKSKNSKISKIQKRVPKIPKNDFFQKYCQIWTPHGHFSRTWYPTCKNQKFKNFQNPKRGTKNTQKWFFFKNNVKFEFHMVILVEIDTPCGKKKISKFFLWKSSIFSWISDIYAKKWPPRAKTKKDTKNFINDKMSKTMI